MVHNNLSSVENAVLFSVFDVCGVLSRIRFVVLVWSAGIICAAQLSPKKIDVTVAHHIRGALGSKCGAPGGYLGINPVPDKAFPAVAGQTLHA